MAGSVLPSPATAQVRAFRERYPDVTVAITDMPSLMQVQALEDGRLDVALMREPPLDQLDLVVHIIAEEEFFAVVPLGHPLGMETAIWLSQLAEDGFILFPFEAAPVLHGKVQALFAASGIQPTVIQEAAEWMTIMGLVSAGAGVSVVPASFMQIGWGGVRHLKLMDSDILTQVGAVGLASHSAPARQYFDMIAAG